MLRDEWLISFGFQLFGSKPSKHPLSKISSPFLGNFNVFDIQ